MRSHEPLEPIVYTATPGVRHLVWRAVGQGEPGETICGLTAHVEGPDSQPHLLVDAPRGGEIECPGCFGPGYLGGHSRTAGLPDEQAKHVLEQRLVVLEQRLEQMAADAARTVIPP